MATTKYAWKQMVTLTKAEGEQMDRILQHYNCPNLSQLCKAVLRGDAVLPICDNDMVILRAQLMQYQRAIDTIQDAVNDLHK